MVFIVARKSVLDMKKRAFVLEESERNECCEAIHYFYAER